MVIDWNVRFGDLLIILSFFGSALYYAFRSGSLAETIKMMQKEIEELKESTKSIAAALTTVAVQKNQIERIEEDMKDLRRGKGWINNASQRTVDGEY